MEGKGTAEIGASPHPSLSSARIAAARAIHGDAVDNYLKHIQIGDPLADDLVKCFERMPRRKGFRVLMQAIETGIESVDDAPDELVALFEQLDQVPNWVDWDSMGRGSAKILQNALLPAISFVAYALPHAYLSTGNKPLVSSATLIDNTARRYGAATRFFTEVFMPGSMQRFGDGFRFAVLTRILHARVRRQILRSAKWDLSIGQPLNQAHMAIGTILFSYFVVDGMRRLGGRVREDEIEGIALVWRYVGYLLGVDPQIAFTCESDARKLIEVGCSLEFDPDEDAKVLCRALVLAFPEILRLENQFAARALMSILSALSRRLLGDRLADRLGYSKNKHRWLCSLGISIAWLFERFPVLIPPNLRRYMGVSFWLLQGSHDPRLD